MVRNESIREQTGLRDVGAVSPGTSFEMAGACAEDERCATLSI